MQDRILQGSSVLFMRLGIKGVTMDDIAKELSVSKKTIYQYYKDKDDLVYHVTRQFIESKCADIDFLVKEADDAVHEQILLSQHIRRTSTGLHPSVMHDMRKYHHKAWRAFEAHRNRDILGGIVANLERGIEDGCYRSDLPVDIISKMRMEQVNIPFNQTLFPIGQYAVPNIQMAILDHFIHGIVSPKGLELYRRYSSEIIN